MCKCEEMSGGLEMERIHGGGGGGGVEQQQPQGGEKEVLEKLISSTTTAAASNNNKVNLHGKGTGRNNHANRQQFNNNPPGNYNNSNNNKKQFRRHHRRQHQNAQRRMNNSNFHEHHGKRIRRNTQPAPNNTNEFLMQEHDHLYHLDFNDDEFEQRHGYIDFNPSHLYSNPEGMVDANHAFSFLRDTNTTISSGPANSGGAFYSSSEDDQDYLSREFSATYDIVNAERLSSMTKAELISEYQLLQDRVELLERKLKTGTDVYGTTTITTTTTDGKINTSSNPSSSNEMVVELFSPPTNTNIVTASTSNPSDDDGDKGGGGEEEGDGSIQEEILKLREENQKIKADNKYLRKMTLKQGKEDGDEVVGMEEDDDMEADRASTDSGTGGMSK